MCLPFFMEARRRAFVRDHALNAEDLGKRDTVRSVGCAQKIPGCNRDPGARKFPSIKKCQAPGHFRALNVVWRLPCAMIIYGKSRSCQVLSNPS
jgi:hypothetical protein